MQRRYRRLRPLVAGGWLIGLGQLERGLSLPSDTRRYEGAIVPIYKPVGPTSFTVVNRIRRRVGVQKVGHAGTLDPFAEGVLVVGIGRSATRALSLYTHQDKEYVGRIRLGVVTDTYDSTGRVLKEVPLAGVDGSQICEVLAEFTGEILQKPPPYSAVKVNGVRLYSAARKGIVINPRPRLVRIHSMELTGVLPTGFEMKINCSSGTYIRALAHDIGDRLGVGAHLESLIRTRTGEFTSERALPLARFLDDPETAMSEAIWI